MNSFNCFIDPKATVHMVNGKWYYSYDKKNYEPVVARFKEILCYDDSGLAHIQMAHTPTDNRWLSLSGECVTRKADQPFGWKRTPHRWLPPPKEELETKYRPFCDKSGKCGVRDLDGNCVVPPLFEEARMLHERIVGVKLEGYWDIIILDEDSRA